MSESVPDSASQFPEHLRIVPSVVELERWLDMLITGAVDAPWRLAAVEIKRDVHDQLATASPDDAHKIAEPIGRLLQSVGIDDAIEALQRVSEDLARGLESDANIQRQDGRNELDQEKEIEGYVDGRRAWALRRYLEALSLSLPEDDVK